jgi:hypothetical protein
MNITPRLFAQALLGQLGMPISPNNVMALIAAQHIEGGWMHNAARYNPLNTTLATAGSYTAMRTPAPIQGYSSWAEGLGATAATLRGSAYAPIRAALASSAPPDQTLAAFGAGPWGWYDPKTGARNPVPLAASSQGEADTPFPPGGGNLPGGLLAGGAALGALLLGGAGLAYLWVTGRL